MSRPGDHDVDVDALGLLCPLPVLRLEAALRRLPPGSVARLRADDEGVLEDVPAWCDGNAHELLGIERIEGSRGPELHCRVRSPARGT